MCGGTYFMFFYVCFGGGKINLAAKFYIIFVELLLEFRLIGFVQGYELAFPLLFLCYIFTATRSFALRERGL